MRLIPLLSKTLNDNIPEVKLGLTTKGLIIFSYLYNFPSTSQKRMSSYSHSRRVGAREDTEREVCDRSQKIEHIVKWDHRRCSGSHRTQDTTRYISFQQEKLKDKVTVPSQYSI